MAERVVAELDSSEGAAVDLRAFIDRVYVIALSRNPDEEEIKMGVDFLQQGGGHTDGTQQVQKLADFCQVIFLTNEFLYVD